MAKNPNEIPPWLLDDDEDGEESSPKPPAPIQGVPGAPSSSSPPRPQGPAPWLSAGGDEEDDEDMLKQGGLSEDWLASGAFLADKVDTELTYDEWIARQQEQRREKSIEEEVPEFHDTGELPDLDKPAAPPTGSTGVLPDWFLGMESMKPEEEPEWMRTGDKFTTDPPIPTVPQENVPAWMRSTGTFDSSPIPEFSGFTPQPEDEESHDEIKSFFDSLGTAETPPEEEEELPPEFMFGDSPISSRAADSQDGVTGILGQEEDEEPPPPPPPSPPRQPIAASMDWDLPSSDDSAWSSVTDEIAAAAAAAGYDTLPDRASAYEEFQEVVNASPDPEVDSMIADGPDESWFTESDEATQYSGEDEPESGDKPSGFGTGTLLRLDEFFGDVAAQRKSSPQESESVDEPDLDWFLNQPEIPATGTLPPQPSDVLDSDSEAEAPPEDSAETLTWLSELSTIVQSVQRGDQDVSAFDSTEDLFTTVVDPIPPSPSFEGLSEESAVDDEFDFGISSIDPYAPPSPSISEFDWEMAAPVPDEPENFDPAQPWLNAFDTETIEAAKEQAANEPEEPLIPRFSDAMPPSHGLTGMLSRFGEPEPEPEPPPVPQQRKPTSLDSDFEAPPVVFDLFGSDEMPAAADDLPSFDRFDAAPSGDLDSFELPDLFGEDDIPEGALDADIHAALYGTPLPSSDAPPTDDDDDFFSLITQDPDVNLLLEGEDDDQAFMFESDEAETPAPKFTSAASILEGDDLDLNDLYSTDEPTLPDTDAILSSFARDEDEIADETLRDLFDAEELSQGEPQSAHEAVQPADLEPGDDFASVLAGISVESEASEPPSSYDPWAEMPLDDDFAELAPLEPVDLSQLVTTEDVNMIGTAEAETMFGDVEDDDLFGELTFADQIDANTPPGQTLSPSDTIDFGDDVDASDTLDLGAELELADAPPAPAPAVAAHDDGDFFGSFALDEEEPSPIESDFFSTFELDEAPEAAPSSDPDFFSSLSFEGEEPVASAADASQPTSDADFFSSLEFQGEPQPSADKDELPDYDPIPAPTSAKPVQELPDWMRDEEPAQEFISSEFEQPPQDDFFTGFETASKQEDEPAAASTPVFSSLEDYLASLNPGEVPEITPETEALLRESNVDLDRLFTEGLPTKTEVTPQSGDLQPGMGADWLDDVQKQTRDVSPSAIVRQLKDKPETELPDRLKKLRQREKEVADKSGVTEAPKRGRRRAAEQPSPEDSSIPGELTAVPVIAPGAMTLAQTVTVKPEQQAKVDLLRSMAAPLAARGTIKPGEARLSAIDLTYDTPFLRDLEDNENALVRQTRTDDLPKLSESPTAAPAKPRAKRRRRTARRYDRLFVSVLILLAMLAPLFITELQIAQPPSSLRDASGAQASAAYRMLNSIAPGDYVLIAAEYGPSSAGELDRMTDAVLRHVLLRGGRPVIISANPFGVVRTGNLIDTINEDAAFLNRINAPGGVLLPNLDYYLIRYLAGGAIGVRSFSEDPAAALSINIDGGSTSIQARSLADFAALMLIADNPDDLRMYAEQVAPMLRAPFLAAVSYAAAPAAEAYTGTAFVFDGLLIGGIDAAAYQAALTTVNPVERGERLPTPTPTIAPTNPPAGEAPSGEAPTVTGQTAIVIGSRTVNVRGGAGTDFAIVTTIAPGAVVQVIELNADQSWVHVLLDDGRDGWVSALLVELSETGSAAPSLASFKAAARQDPDPTGTPRPTRTPASTLESTAEASAADATAEATAAPFVLPTLTLDTNLSPDELAERRFSAFYMGIIASSAVIALGAVFNIVRGLRKRRGR